MSQDRKSDSGRIIREAAVQREFCREAARNLGEPDNSPIEANQIKAGATKRLRKERTSHSISKDAQTRGLARDKNPDGSA